MVKSTNFRERHHATLRRRVDASWCGRVLVEGEMGSRPKIIGEISGQHTSQMPLAEYDHMVQTLPPD